MHSRHAPTIVVALLACVWAIVACSRPPAVVRVAPELAADGASRPSASAPTSRLSRGMWGMGHLPWKVVIESDDGALAPADIAGLPVHVSAWDDDGERRTACGSRVVDADGVARVELARKPSRGHAPVGWVEAFRDHPETFHPEATFPTIWRSDARPRIEQDEAGQITITARLAGRGWRRRVVAIVCDDPPDEIVTGVIHFPGKRRTSGNTIPGGIPMEVTSYVDISMFELALDRCRNPEHTAEIAILGREPFRGAIEVGDGVRGVLKATGRSIEIPFADEATLVGKLTLVRAARGLGWFGGGIPVGDRDYDADVRQLLCIRLGEELPAFRRTATAAGLGGGLFSCTWDGVAASAVAGKTVTVVISRGATLELRRDVTFRADGTCWLGDIPDAK